MPRISMQQAYDNRDVIAQIYKMLADVADSVAKATEAVAKALEAMETAETAEEAVAGKQDALTTEQLAAVDSGITAEGVTQIGELDERTEILASTAEANVGDVLLLDGNKDPSWGELELLPDVTSASAGDVLALNEDKEPVWMAQGVQITYERKGYLSLGSSSSPIAPGEYSTTEIQLGDIPNLDEKDIIIFVSLSDSRSQFSVHQGFQVLSYSKNRATGSNPTIPASVYNLTNANMTNGARSTYFIFSKPKEGDTPIDTIIGNCGILYSKLVPAYKASDAGKVLSVNSSGELEWITPQ